jgi:protein involved in polysaccharide export with SLBB domain
MRTGTALCCAIWLLGSACATNVGDLRERAEQDAARPPVVTKFPESAALDATAPPPALPPPSRAQPYVLGPEDVIAIRVYQVSDLDITQAIRPDGKISILPVGDVQAAGLTVEQLRLELRKRISSIVREPIVNVVVTEYNSRKVAILGSVRKPGLLTMQSDLTLLEGVSKAGGLSAEADLYRALLYRDDDIVPVDFDRLFRKGDLAQNVRLRSGDAVYVPSIRDNKVYVLGEVGSPGVISWQGSISLLQAIPLVGGLTKEARGDMVLVIRGGVSDPHLQLVDLAALTRSGKLENDIVLERGDVVFVPKSTFAQVEHYTDFALKVMQMVLQGEAAIILGDQVRDVMRGVSNGVGSSIILNP